MKKIILLLFFLLILAPKMTSGAGIAVNPPQIELQALANKKTSAELNVANPTADVQLFEVYADDFGNIIKAQPASFTLEAGGARVVVITFQDINENAKKFQTNMSVVAKPLAESRFQANSGVKIPITITVTTAPEKSKYPPRVYYFISSGIIFITLSVYYLFKYLEKRKTR